jgi:hypothetical protein
MERGRSLSAARRPPVQDPGAGIGGQGTAHRALETARRWGERGNEARARFLLGELYEASGEVEHARTEYEEALAIAKHGAMHQLSDKCLFNLTRLSG